MAKILIVEDSPDNMKLFRTLLISGGHEVTGLPAATDCWRRSVGSDPIWY